MRVRRHHSHFPFGPEAWEALDVQAVRLGSRPARLGAGSAVGVAAMGRPQTATKGTGRGWGSPVSKAAGEDADPPETLVPTAAPWACQLVHDAAPASCPHARAHGGGGLSPMGRSQEEQLHRGVSRRGQPDGRRTAPAAPVRFGNAPECEQTRPHITPTGRAAAPPIGAGALQKREGARGSQACVRRPQAEPPNVLPERSRRITGGAPPAERRAEGRRRPAGHREGQARAVHSSPSF